MIEEILEEHLGRRRPRANHRGVKRKMSNYPLVDRSKDHIQPLAVVTIKRPPKRPR